MNFNIINLLPIKLINIDNNYMYSYLINYQYLLINLNFLKQHQNYRFKVLSTISCVDYPELKLRFELIYTLLSIDFPFIIQLKTKISEFVNIDSSSIFFKSAVWLEREVWDMFGVYFINNYDLRRILTDYGFPYHPLRKTFPLQGFDQIIFDQFKKKIVYIDNIYIQTKSIKHINTTWNKLI